MLADRADVCCPPPGTAPGSWHRLTYKSAEIIQRWYGDEDQWVDLDTTSEKLAAEGYRYHSAVPKPEEVEALRKVVLTLWRAEDPGGIFPAMKAAGLLDPTADYAQFSLTPLGRRALGVEG